MSLKHGLLGLLSYAPSTGYDLAKRFKGSLSLFWHAKPSQVYRELDAMEKSGWLISEHVIQNDKPNKRVYTITDNGKAEFSNWISPPDSLGALQAKSEFLMRLFFAGEMDKEQTVQLLRLYQKECSDGIANLEAAKDIIARNEASGRLLNHALYWKLTVSHGETLCKATVKWTEEAIAMLEASI